MSAGAETKCYKLGDPTIPFVDKEDQFDFTCEGFASPRAQMSCGHVVTPMSLTKWCKHLVEKGDSQFVCGQSGCDAVWPFKEVCKMALLTPEEKDYFEKTMSFNAAARNPNSKFCPGCMSPVTRGSSLNLYIHCKVCSGKTGRTFAFCWQCLREWKGIQPRFDRCENDDCHNSALKTLRECPEIQIQTENGAKGCPSVRACPTCGSLIQHTGKGCKIISCPRCHMQFCFGCLKSTLECIIAQNRVLGKCPCDIAPRQTSIPMWQRKI
ncbi:potential E3 ubiquitin-protein ligase ariadne-2-like [Cyprinodon tularosa]|uniref:potential E3 ubiquitin-protein ligase ariadne-2-like n=1 Tax=Cyprinodon tularosa TaxID=77115 RepID=UPI0018E25F0E|nr:potential E3 ubiquitin-protein ligase ariadne-2-like [Cyprinodon tularosa]